MPRGNGDVTITRVTGEPRHWIEYGIFVFVFLTAIATAMAAWYTRRQRESAVDNGHRQLRAYVPEQANLVWQGTAKPTAAEIVIKNSGQTPAYRLSTATAILVSDHPLQSDLHFPAMPDNHTVIPPAASTALSVAIEQPLSGDQLKAIQKGTQAIYVFGRCLCRRVPRMQNDAVSVLLYRRWRRECGKSWTYVSR
jgi:hypothetical protein